MSWDKVIEAHSGFAVRLYPYAQISEVARESGLTVNSNGTNTAGSYEDVERYLKAVEKILGETAAVSARLKINNKMKELNMKAVK